VMYDLNQDRMLDYDHIDDCHLYNYTWTILLFTVRFVTSKHMCTNRLVNWTLLL
jgi:hypothetical protein